jgi:hypothetical protein
VLAFGFSADGKALEHMHDDCVSEYIIKHQINGSEFVRQHRGGRRIAAFFVSTSSIGDQHYAQKVIVQETTKYH